MEREDARLSLPLFRSVVDGVLFDLDETLLDRAASIAIYGRQFLSDFIKSILEPPEAFLESFLRLDGNGYTPREEFFRVLAAHIGADRLDAGRIAAHFAEHAWTKPVLMSGAVDLLSRLKAAGVPIGIVTNGGSRNQRRKISNTGLDQFVDEVFISEECGVRKPDPEIFLSALERLRVPAERGWFVGDNPLADVVGAHRVGCRTIWLRRSLPWPDEHPACFTAAIDTLNEAIAVMWPVSTD